MIYFFFHCIPSDTLFGAENVVWVRHPPSSPPPPLPSLLCLSGKRLAFERLSLAGRERWLAVSAAVLGIGRGNGTFSSRMQEFCRTLAVRQYRSARNYRNLQNALMFGRGRHSQTALENVILRILLYDNACKVEDLAFVCLSFFAVILCISFMYI